MKVENKTLIITDPSYIAKDENWGTEFDWDVNTITEPEITDYVWVSSGYGDGSPEVFELERDVCIDEYFEDLGKARKDMDDETENELLSIRNVIGEYGIDSGTMCVMILDEALSYNPDCLEDLPETCYCIIDDFTGTIESFTDCQGYNHFVLTPTNTREPLIVTD